MSWHKGKKEFLQTRLCKNTFTALSCAIVALGQPAISPILGMFAASFGFGLYWANSPRSKVFSFVWFLCVQLVQLSWMSSIEYQGRLFLFVYFGVCAALSLQFSLFTSFLWKEKKISVFGSFAFAGLWTLLEWVRSFFLCGFMFNQVGVALSSSIYSSQLASLFGVFGLSFYAVFTNLLFFCFWSCGKKRELFLWLYVLCAPCVFGFLSISYHQQKINGSAKMPVLLLQTGLLPSQRAFFPSKPKEFIPAINQWQDALVELAKWKGETVEIIVFPEGAFPYGLDKKKYTFVEAANALALIGHTGFQGEEMVANRFFLETIAKSFRSSVLVGLDGCKLGKNYNCVFSFDKEGSLEGEYQKQVLLPVAEYNPFSFLNAVSAFYGIESFFSKGKGPAHFTKHKISPVICYEELFPELVRKGRRQGGGALLTLSSDGWYPHSTLPMQHFTHGKIRAIENGAPLIRCGNTGVSAIVNALGVIEGQLSGEKKGSALISTSLYQYKTLFSRTGNIPIILFSLFFCLLFFLRKYFYFLKAQHISL